VGDRWRHGFAPASTPLRCVPPGHAWEENWRGVLACGTLGGMSDLANELQRHYGLLLGIQSPWQVRDVKLELANKRVEIELVWMAGAKAVCPVCGTVGALYDLAPERTWRHLDTMQFQTVIRARVPPASRAVHGRGDVHAPPPA
jgi:hypothetical protein